MSYKPLRWGIIGAGNISHDFCVALSTLPSQDHVVTHVAARDIERAKNFAEEFDIKTHSGDYMNVMRDANVDAVYIATLNNTHKQLSILAINHGKAVLCEKPAGLNSEELDEILKAADEKKILFVEVVMIRTNPAIKYLREKLTQDYLGEAEVLNISYGYQGLMQSERVRTKELGGGVLLTFGYYLLSYADVLFRGVKPVEIIASGEIDQEAGVESLVGIIMKFEGHKMANLTISANTKLSNEVHLMCSLGEVDIKSPIHAPTLYIEKYGDVEKEYHFPLMKTDKKTKFGNTVALRYEAEHVRQCLLEGLTQSPLISHDTSRRIMGYVEEIKKQIGCSQ